MCYLCSPTFFCLTILGLSLWCTISLYSLSIRILGLTLLIVSHLLNLRGIWALFSLFSFLFSYLAFPRINLDTILWLKCILLLIYKSAQKLTEGKFNKKIKARPNWPEQKVRCEIEHPPSNSARETIAIKFQP